MNKADFGFFQWSAFLIGLVFVSITSAWTATEEKPLPKSIRSVDQLKLILDLNRQELRDAQEDLARAEANLINSIQEQQQAQRHWEAYKLYREGKQRI
jgi:hypothetical protein